MAIKNQLIQAKENEKLKAEQDLVKSEEKVAQLNQSIEAGASKAAPVNQVYSQIIDEVNIASDAAKTNTKSGYTLGNVKLNLKTFEIGRASCRERV